MVGPAYADPKKKAIRATLVDGITIDASDIEIGAVEIKDSSTDNRASVTPSGELKVSLSSDTAGVKDVNVTNSSIDTNVLNIPSDYPDSVAHAKLDTINTSISSVQQREITNFPTDANGNLKVSLVSDIAGVKDVNVTNTNLDVTVSNQPSDYPDSGSHEKLDAINAKIVKADTDNVTVSNFPADYPDTTAHTKLDAINSSISAVQQREVTNFPTDANGNLKVSILSDASGTKDVNVTNSSIDTNVLNFPSDYPDSAAHTKLDTINSTLHSTLSRSISNFPSSYPLPQSQHDKLREFMALDVEDADPLTYVGQERKDGFWLIMKIDSSSGTSIRYASSLNNSSYSNYSDAWDNRSSLAYGTVSEAVD